MTDVTEKVRGAPPAVVDLLRGLEQRDMDLMLRGLAPDARWTLVGKPERFVLGGTKDASEVADMLRVALPGFHRFHFEVLAWAQNGDTVFVEAITRAAGPGTAAYSNTYLMRFAMEDGLVARVLEHYDPFEALDYLDQVAAQQA
jgi:ketosteroid isomerase-like protein